ncbi:MAG: response regulator [Microcoleaceae cyanobacterium]
MTSSPFRLLLIDDNANDRQLVLRLLKREIKEFEVIEPLNQKDLDRVLERGNFNFIITDYQLLWTTGLKILHQVKSKYPLCPIVMFTGTGNEEIAVKAMKAGLDDYVIKSPKHFAQLAASVRSLWELDQQRQARKEIENRYRRLFDGVPIGLYRMTPTGEVIEANPAFIKMLGYDNLEDILRQNVIDIHVDSEHQQTWQKVLQVKGTIKNFETELYRRDGIPIWVRHTIRAVQNEQGNILYYEGSLEDISDDKLAEIERVKLLQQAQAAQQQAEDASRLKDEFLATLSHELRTPLNAILGWLQLLRQGRLSAEMQAQAIETIDRNAQAQNQLIGDILDVSRIIQGKVKLNMIPLNPCQAINAAIDSIRPTANSKDIQLQLCCDPKIGQISADPNRLQQVIWNLLVNAIKFTPAKGKITVEAQRVSDQIQIQVKDTGQGIATEDLPYVFERFRQVEQTSKRQQGGLGLGLSIVRYMIEMHGGEVAVESGGVGKGTTFTLLLPRLTSEASPDQPLDENSHRPILPKLEAARILLVEDEPDARTFVSLILKDYGAEVVAVAKVTEAMTQLENQPSFDLLVSDIAMPEVDGYDFIQQVRRRYSAVNLPAIALTAYAREIDRKKAIESGFQRHLAKPIEANILVEAIAELIQS